MTAFRAIVAQDVAIGFRSGGGALLAAIFFALVVLLFALAAGPEPARLAAIASPVLWTGALLSTLITAERIWQADQEDGALDVLVETSDVLEVAFLAKALAHWLTTAAPLILLSPAMALMLNLPGDAYGPLIATLGLGTPGLSLTAALVGATTVSLRRAGALVTILAAPLFTPILVFGVGAAEAGAAGSPAYPSSLMFLGVSVLLALIVAPVGGAAAIRANIA